MTQVRTKPQPQSSTIRQRLRRLDLQWRTAIVWLAGLYVVLAPNVELLPSLGLYNGKRVLQIGLLAAGGILLLAVSRERKQWLTTFTTLPLLARIGLGCVLGLGLLSAAQAPSSGHAFLEVGHFALLFVLAGIVAMWVRRSPERADKVVLGVLTVSVLLYAVQFLVGYGMYLSMGDIDLWPDAYIGFGNIRHFNQYQTWTLPLLVVPVLMLPRRWRIARRLIFGLLALWWMLVIASNVRGTPIAMAVAAAGVGLLFRERAKEWLGTQFAALLAGGAFYYLMFYVLAGATPQLVERLGEVGQSRRLEHWWTCLEMAWTHPWLGAGPMHFAWPPFHFAPAAHPHNALMQWLGEWGILSTLIVVGLVCWGGWAWMQQEHQSSEGPTSSLDALRVGLVAAVLAGAAHALVSGIIVMPVSQILMVLILGWAWGRYQPFSPRESFLPSRRAQILLSVILIASVGILGRSIREGRAMKERRTAFLETVERNRLSPRYWAQGYFGVRNPDVIERARLKR